MASFKDFIKEKLVPAPPTDNEIKWALTNFSSRVDPPITVSRIHIYTNPGDPYDPSVPSAPSNAAGSNLPDNEIWEFILANQGSPESPPNWIDAVFSFDTLQGLSELTVAGVSFTVNQVLDFDTVNGVVDTGKGIVTLYSTEVLQADSENIPLVYVISYSYTLLAAVANDSVIPDDGDTNDDGGYNDCIKIRVTDTKNVSVEDNLIIRIIDDVPTAFDDGINTVTENGTTVVYGSVTFNDASGADETLTFVEWLPSNADVITELNVYGVLTLESNGDWSYVLDNSRPETQALTEADYLLHPLQYSIKDSDGDIDIGAVTIAVRGTSDVCILGPLFTSFNMYLQGLEVSVIYTGHSLIDVPFED